LRVRSAIGAAVTTITRTITVAAGVFAPGHPGHRCAGPARQGPARQHAAILLKVIAQWRNHIEATLGEITDQMELARHGAHTFWAC
jgi:hypothetical protein